MQHNIGQSEDVGEDDHNDETDDTVETSIEVQDLLNFGLKQPIVEMPIKSVVSEIHHSLKYHRQSKFHQLLVSQN